MIVRCPTCQVDVSIDETSNSTAFVCSSCGSVININRAQHDGSPYPPAGAEDQAGALMPDDAGAYGPFHNQTSEALEPITDMSQNPGGMPGMEPTVDYLRQEMNGGGREGGLVFDGDNIFDQIGDEPPLDTASQYRPMEGTPEAQYPSPADQFAQPGQPNQLPADLYAQPGQQYQPVSDRFAQPEPQFQAPAYTPPQPSPRPTTPPGAGIQVPMQDVACPICKTTNQIQAGATGMHNCSSCGSLFSAGGSSVDHDQSGDDLIGKQIGGCRVENKIGEGGMGAVYKGIQISLDREVAIKILPRQYSRNMSFIQRFEREAKSLAKINHQNIMQIYDFGMHGDMYYMIMEFIRGKSLAEHLEERYVYPLEDALLLIYQSALGLQCAQKNGVIHRDVKPDNIMIDANGVVKMTDFGLAKMIGSGASELTQEGVRVGTPAFMSPEQCKGQKSLDVRTDIYSLGVTFYFALSGKLPFVGDSPFSIMLKHQNQKATPLKNLVPNLPDSVSDIVEKMMEKDPDDRYQTWDDFIDHLEAVKRFLAVETNIEEEAQDKNRFMDTLDIDVQKHRDELPPEWDAGSQPGAPAGEPAPAAEEGVRTEEVARLTAEGDRCFADDRFDEAINTWQKALFIEPNNIVIQDRISEARSRLRLKKIEDMLSEAGVLEKRKKYKATLAKLNDILTLKLTWQVKDMVEQSIHRVQERMQRRRMIFRSFRLLVLFVVLIGALITCYPSYLQYFAWRQYQTAEKLEQQFFEVIGRDIDQVEKKAREAMEAYRRILDYAITDKGPLGLIYREMGKQNPYIDIAKQRIADLELRVEKVVDDARIQTALNAAAVDENDGRYIEAVEKMAVLVEENGDHRIHGTAIREQYERVKALSDKAYALYNAAIANDVFEATDSKKVEALAAYERIEAACTNYEQLAREFPNTSLAKSAKVGFRIESDPPGAEVTVVTKDGHPIRIRDQVTPLTIPIHRENELFAVVLEKSGFRKEEKKYWQNTIDRKSDRIALQVGAAWKCQIIEGYNFKSPGFLAGDRLFLLANNRVFAVDTAARALAWPMPGEASPLYSPKFNDEQGLAICRDSIIVPGTKGEMYRIQMTAFDPGTWKRESLAVPQGSALTAPVVAQPAMLMGKEVLFFGGGKDSGFLGAMILPDGTSAWGGGAATETKTDIKGKAVNGDILCRPFAEDGYILAVTTASKVYRVHMGTGEFGATPLDIPEAGPAGRVTGSGGFVVFIGKARDNEEILAACFDGPSGARKWQVRMPGKAESVRPVIADGKVVFGYETPLGGVITALALETGAPVWKYPAEKGVEPITVGLTVAGNRIFCAARERIIILGMDGKLLHDKYTVKYARIMAPLIVREEYIYAMAGDGSVYAFYIPPDLPAQ